jgi:hypothetical protein
LGRLLKQIAADRCGLVWLLCITLVGAVVRIWFLNQPMRQDEAQTHLSFVAQGVDRLFYYQAPNNHVADTLPVCPEGRRTNYSVWLGQTISRIVDQDLKHHAQPSTT